MREGEMLSNEVRETSRGEPRRSERDERDAAHVDRERERDRERATRGEREIEKHARAGDVAKGVPLI